MLLAFPRLLLLSTLLALLQGAALAWQRVVARLMQGWRTHPELLLMLAQLLYFLPLLLVSLRQRLPLILAPLTLTPGEKPLPEHSLRAGPTRQLCFLRLQAAALAGHLEYRPFDQHCLLSAPIIPRTLALVDFHCVLLATLSFLAADSRLKISKRQTNQLAW